MPGGSSGSSFVRQLSARSEAWKPAAAASRRWHGGAPGIKHCHRYSSSVGSGSSEKGLIQVGDEFAGYGGDCGGSERKRVMVVVDQSSHSKHAMMWALTHVVDHGDLLTLLHVVNDSVSSPPHLAPSLASLCKACKPEVEIEALVIQGPRLETVLSQVKKLEVSVLVLGQKRPSSLFNCFLGSSSNEEFVEECINNAECMTIGVRKQSRGNGGYLISTRWQKNFWLLA